MKRLFLLIAVCMIGMVLPQGMWAGVTIDTSTSGKVVVTSENAGDFAAYLNSASTEQLNALKVNEIVFVGKFNETDLSTLQAKNCATQKKVDMAEAKFIKSASSSGGSSSPYLYHNIDAMNNNTSNKNEGDRCITGGVKYASGTTDNINFDWIDKTGTDQDYTDNNQLNSLGSDPKRYSNLNEAGKPESGDYSSVILVGGDDYVFHNGSWVDASQGGGDDNDEYDYTQMKFYYWGNNVEEIITSNYATGAMAGQLCSDCSNLKTLTLSAGDFSSTALGNNISSLETVTIKNQVTALAAGMFNGAGTTGSNDNLVQNLKTVTFEDGCQIKTLPNAVFKNTGITSLTIPSSVELIEAEAFHTCQSLATVTFVNTNPDPLVIKSTAFQQSDHIKDIYLNVNPSERLLICEYNAFDFHSMEGQTAEGGEMATLHFAEENFDYYAGEWKKGMALKQTDLNKFKDGLDVTYNGQQYIAAPTQNESQLNGGYAQVDNSSDGYYHPSDASKKYAPANGWQQFAKTASDREIEIIGNVYMTYSTDTPYSLPKGIVAFRVTDYKEATTDANGKTKNGRLVLKQIDQVPTETGMLLISTDQYVVKNTTDISVFFFGDPVETPAKYHYTMGKAGDATSNYLAPAVHGIAVGPTSKGEPNAVTGAIDWNGKPFDHRNFAMSKSTHQFVRVKKITMPDNRAFLSLPTTMFTNDNESATEGPNPWNTQAGDAFSTYETTQYDESNNGGNAKTNMFFEYDVEKYGMIWPLVKDEGPSGITTSISNVKEDTVQTGIYTLQGVKVSSPSTKGIYIVNGKKVIIK